MKNILITTLIVAAASTAFAELTVSDHTSYWSGNSPTETVMNFWGVKGTGDTKTGNASDIAATLATKNQALTIEGATINFVKTSITFTNPSQKFSNSYAVRLCGSTLNIDSTSVFGGTDSSGLVMATYNRSFIDGTSEKQGGTFGGSTITVGNEADSKAAKYDITKEGGLNVERILTMSTILTLNLHKANAIFNAAANNSLAFIDVSMSLTVNASADQHVAFGSRNNGLIVNITDGAFFCIDDWGAKTSPAGASNYITIAENGLNNGAVLFLKDTVDTPNFENLSVTKTHTGTKGDQTLSFRLEGEDTSPEGLIMKEITFDGKDYIAFTMNESILDRTAVPEPAEWAAIFGGIALALAIYRRRK